MKVLITSLFTLLLLSHQTPAQTSGDGKFIQRQLDKAGPANKGPKPDYSNASFWAALPFKENASDFIPQGLAKTQSSKEVDVFFIHPTTYITANGNEYRGEDIKEHPLKVFKKLKEAPWNADLSDEAVNIRTDTLSLRNQATVFNESCRIFAPRYRQANIKAFLVSKESVNAQQAFDVAYGDVKEAFQYYLDHYNNGHPIIIAGHSQGSLLAIRLLKEFFDGKTLQNKLVCAYVVGHPVPPATFAAIPVCSSPHQTGCVAGWQSFNADASISDDMIRSRSNTIAVNPMTWTTDHNRAPANLNEGALTNTGVLVPGKFSCRIDENNFLRVETDATFKALLKNAGNFHIWDYNLFWMNIRTNVAGRIGMFYKN